MKPRLARNNFLLFGSSGFMLSLVLTAILLVVRSLPWMPYILMVSTGVLAFFLLAFFTKIVNGAESYTFYYHLLFSMSAVSLALWACSAPVLQYLDLYTTGFGLLHISGRLGCYTAGCCHGRPAGFGIRYGEEYLSSGFPGYLINVKLFPVQLAEASGLLLITAFCIFLFLGSPAPGAVWTSYITGYAVLRYLLEFARGDTDRSFFATFSQAQWISLSLLLALYLGGIFHLWPSSFAATISGGILILLSCIVYTTRGLFPGWQTSNALHLQELSRAFSAQQHRSSPVVTTTSQGIRLSLTRLEPEEHEKWLCSLSYTGRRKAYPVLKQAFRQLRLMHFENFTTEEKKGNSGIYHFIVSRKSK
jgi:hypothetical protein